MARIPFQHHWRTVAIFRSAAYCVTYVHAWPGLDVVRDFDGLGEEAVVRSMGAVFTLLYVRLLRLSPRRAMGDLHCFGSEIQGWQPFDVHLVLAASLFSCIVRSIAGTRLLLKQEHGC